jgi:DNA-binding MarR family transcriptional regulator
VLPNSTVLPYYYAVMQEELLLRFRRAYWQVFREVDTLRLQQWERSRVTLPQLRVLSYLRRNPGATTKALSRSLGITVSTASGLVIKLVERGLVERTTLADDRRQLPLQLTDLGASVLGELSESVRGFLEQLCEQLGDELPSVLASLECLAEAGQAVHAGTAPAASTGAER